MGKQQRGDTSKGKLLIPSHRPMPGVDDEVIDAGATEGAQLPSEATEKARGKLQRQGGKEEPPKGFDPDDLSR